MKKITAILVLVCFTALGLQAQKLINDPDAEARNTGSFTAIKVSNAFDVYLTQADETGVAVSATKAEYKNNIKTEVSNGVLKISFDNDRKWKFWNDNKMKLRVYISFKELKRLEAGGACDIHFLTPVHAQELSINLSGASDIKDGTFDAQKLDIKLSGASDMRIKGTATQLSIEASGASDFKSIDFAADYCDVDASGASSIHLTVNKELSARASGASDVIYKGDGSIREIKSSGASNISHRS